MDFKNKNVVITGAASGIGAATARLFAAQGASVTIGDIDDIKGTNLCSEITEAGGEAKYCHVNTASFNEVKNFISESIDVFGSVDILVNNAGIGPGKLVKTAEATLNDWDKVIAVNQSGVFYGMKCALGHMLKQGYGNIVNIASLAGLKASVNNISYAASKFAVVGMTKAAALEYASRNIRINAVCPGYTHSALLDRLLNSAPEMDERLLKLIPQKRFGKAEEIAEAVCWLASEKTGFITGQAMVLDGGTGL